MFVLLAVIGALYGLAIMVWATASIRQARDLQTTLLRMAVSLSELAAGPEQGFSTRLLDLEDQVERLPKKWEDLKRDAAAAETRARAHIRRAQKELDERGFSDPGVDQMGLELSERDGGGGADNGLQPVRGGVEDVAGQAGEYATPVEEDWLAEATRVKFGF